MTDTSVLYLVCSDRVHSGKTLLARLLVDWLLLRGTEPQVIDLDNPAYPLAGLYPDLSLKVDFDHTLGRVGLFDGIVRKPDVDRVLEVPVLHMDAFLREARNLQFFETVAASGGDLAFLHFVDGSPAFVDKARKLAETLPPGVHYYLVRNTEADVLGNDAETAEIYETLKREGDIQFPRLAADLVALIEQPGFSFAAFMNGDITVADTVLRFKLQQFVKTMFAQFNRIALQIEIKAFRDSGVV